MDMNAFTTDLPQAPTDTSFRLARRRTEYTRIAAEAASKATEAVPPTPPLDIDAD
ncbi:hypothetical protein F5141DRAFT_1102828, partial [Pisolithus sp. B1]